MQHTERVAEIEYSIIEGQMINRSVHKAAVWAVGQVFAGDIERGGAGVNAVEMSDARGCNSGPASAATAEVESDAAAGQPIPGKDVEVEIKDLPQLLFAQAGLIIVTPFLTKPGDSSGVLIGLH